jgi:hypothetical protein
MAGRILYSSREGMSSKVPEKGAEAERKGMENNFSPQRHRGDGRMGKRRSFLCIGRLGWKFLVFDRELSLSLVHGEGGHRHIDALPH